MRTAYPNEELYHYGILGMKWGVRRYQDKLGRLTAAGIKRYEKRAERKTKSEIFRSKVDDFAYAKKKIFGKGEDIEEVKKQADKKDSNYTQGTFLNDKNAERLKADVGKPIIDDQNKTIYTAMTAKEMQEYANKLKAEKEINELYKDSKEGKNKVIEFLKEYGKYAAVIATAVGVTTKIVKDGGFLVGEGKKVAKAAGDKIKSKEEATA